MGLAEKRVARALQIEHFPAWTKLVQAACPDVPLEIRVQWDDLVKEGFLDYYPKNVEYNFFAPLARALTAVCADDLGRDALKERIKTIQITSQRSWCSLQAKVEGDTLILDSDPSYGKTEDDCKAYAKDIQTALEAAL